MLRKHKRDANQLGLNCDYLLTLGACRSNAYGEPLVIHNYTGMPPWQA
jgi:hypothetical protein